MFAISKIKKLYPLHIILLFPAIVLQIYSYHLNGFSALDILSDLIQKIIANVLLIQAWIPSSSFYFSLNGVSWYLSLSLFCYFMFPMICRQGKKMRTNKCLLETVVCVILIQCIVGITFTLFMPEYVYWFTYICPLYRLGDFIIGYCIGRIFSNRKSEISNYTAIELIAVIAMVAAHVIYNVVPGTWWKSDLLFLSSSVLLVYSFAQNKGVISRILGNKLIIWIGNLSAYTYLLHQIIIRYLKALDFAGIILGISAFVITVAIAYMYRIADLRIKTYWI